MAFVSVNAGVLNKHGWCGSTAAALSSSLHVTRGCILRCERAVCVEDNSNACVLLLERVQAHRRVLVPRRRLGRVGGRARGLAAQRREARLHLSTHLPGQRARARE